MDKEQYQNKKGENYGKRGERTHAAEELVEFI